MKKLLIIILITLVIVTGALITVLDKQKAVEASYENIYDDIPSISNDDIFDLGEGTQVVYYYQPECGFCNEYKPTLAEYNEKIKHTEGVDLYAVDATKEQDLFVSSDDEKFTEDVDVINERQELYIVGTPTAIQIQDGKVTMYGVGADSITTIMEASV